MFLVQNSCYCQPFSQPHYDSTTAHSKKMLVFKKKKNLNKKHECTFSFIRTHNVHKEIFCHYIDFH